MLKLYYHVDYHDCRLLDLEAEIRFNIMYRKEIKLILEIGE